MIFFIDGPPRSGKTTVAQALRGWAISQKRGALIVDDKMWGGDPETGAAPPEARRLLEKVIEGVAIPDNKTIADIEAMPWKADPVIMFVGTARGALDEFEKIAPGFTKKFGPVTTLTTALASVAKK